MERGVLFNIYLQPNCTHSMSAVQPNRLKYKDNLSTVLTGWGFRKFQVLQELRTNVSVLLLPQNPENPQKLWPVMGCSSACTTARAAVKQHRPSNPPPPTHTLLHTDLFSFTHSHPTHPDPFLLNEHPPPPQLQEIPNDVHHRRVGLCFAKRVSTPRHVHK